MLVLLVMGGLLAGTVALQAQDAAVNPSQIREKGVLDFEAIVKRLALSGQQIIKIKPVLGELNRFMARWNDDTSATPDVQAAERKKVQAEINLKLKAILTPEQFTQWEQLNFPKEFSRITF